MEEHRAIAMTFSDSLLSHTDANGCIAWVDAYMVACDHGLRREFQESYGRSFAAWGYTGVDAGEFLVWLGY
jgi:hypothetical protein